jgi:hypothetical protein
LDATAIADHLAATRSGAFEMEMNSISERKPTIGFWATMAGLAALAYLLSFGPVVWLTDRRIFPEWVHGPAAFVYAPVVHVSLAGPRPIRGALVWYAELGSKQYKEPLIDDPATPAIEL